MKASALSLVLVVTVAAPRLVFAQEASATSGKAYVAAKVGVVVPKHDDLEGFDNGFALEGVVGYRASENVAVEFAVGRFSMSGTFNGVTDTGIFYTEEDTVTALPVTVALKGIVPVDRLELFALLGGGAYFISAHAEAKSPGYRTLTASDSDSAFGLNLGGGFSLRLSDRAVLGAEVKYITGTVKVWDETNHFDSIIVGAALTFSL
jgi:opacity protein-like surface antigen